MERGNRSMNKNIPSWLLEIEADEIEFIKNFILASGSLKDMAALYKVSYPTVRLRLDKLIQKIGISESTEAEPFVSYIKKLAVDSKVELDIAKQIIEKYNEETNSRKE